MSGSFDPLSRCQPSVRQRAKLAAPPPSRAGTRLHRVVRLTHPLLRSIAISALTLIGTIASSNWSLCVLHWSLPPSDGAHERAPYGHPLVPMVTPYFAILSWFAVCPIALALLWRADLRRSFPILFTVAFATIAGVVPFAFVWAWPASVVATVLTMAVCHWQFPLARRSSNNSQPPLVIPAR